MSRVSANPGLERGLTMRPSGRRAPLVPIIVARDSAHYNPYLSIRANWRIIVARDSAHYNPYLSIRAYWRIIAARDSAHYNPFHSIRAYECIINLFH
jgi:hypothetical protein